jgi:hypothetical protein
MRVSKKDACRFGLKWLKTVPDAGLLETQYITSGFLRRKEPG